jgi:asparagine synthase (glutamine-hydrolysing)
MSVQFGRWNFEGQPPAGDYIEKVSTTLAPHGPDSNETYSKGGVKILYRAFHTTKESRRETQPYISPSGAVITWDGRLDNRTELISELRHCLTINTTDVAIVAAAYEQWGAPCFAKLIGDWALSIWNPNNCTLILAKDPIGTRHLYYYFDNNHIDWSSILDPLVRFAVKTFAISEEYIAGWFSYLPAVHLTPYVGIHSVPPSSFVLLRPGKRTLSKYWDFDPAKIIRYRTDAEYEEHFRTVFATAVQRRLRSDRPVLAELSGGMDSSSIVCMADLVIGRGQVECPRLDTISWYDDSEPHWNDRPYFTKVEEKRGRTGYHIDLAAQKERTKSKGNSGKSFLSRFESDRLAVALDSNCDSWPELFEHQIPYIRSNGYRVTLSGIGGEGPTGGFVPTPTPELQNLLARARFSSLASQLAAWAEKMGESRLHLLWGSIRGFFARSIAVSGAPKDVGPAPWFRPGFLRRNHAALHWYPSRVKLFGPLPSFQNHIHQLNHERRFLAYCGLQPELPRELRYPYLDRSFLEFMYAIPREQIVGVGKRRFLMKRALVGIVPYELITRKRRAAPTQEPEKDAWTEWPSLVEMGDVVSSSLGIMDSNRFLQALQKAHDKEEVPIDSLKRALFLESWLRHLAIHGVLTVTTMSIKGTSYSSLKTNTFQRLFSTRVQLASNVCKSNQERR